MCRTDLRIKKWRLKHLGDFTIQENHSSSHSPWFGSCDSTPCFTQPLAYGRIWFQFPLSGVKAVGAIFHIKAVFAPFLQLAPPLSQ